MCLSLRSTITLGRWRKVVMEAMPRIRTTERERGSREGGEGHRDDTDGRV